MKSTSEITTNAIAALKIAGADDNSLDQTVYFSNQAILMMLTAVVVELQNLREAVENKKG